MCDNVHMEKTTLASCPIGLFISDTGDLCLKTEYGDNNGGIDAYIVSSGEFFWGKNPQTIQSQRDSVVRPVCNEEVEKFMESLCLKIKPE